MPKQQIADPAPKPEAKLCQKTKDAIKMVNAGIDPREALKMVNYKDTITAKSVCVLKQKVKKYSLSQPSTVRLAETQVKRILRGRGREEAHQKVTKDGEVVEYTDNIYPTDSNIMAAAAMVYDRYEPVRPADQDSGQAQNPGTHVDLRQYQINVHVNKP